MSTVGTTRNHISVYGRRLVKVGILLSTGRNQKAEAQRRDTKGNWAQLPKMNVLGVIQLQGRSTSIAHRELPGL